MEFVPVGLSKIVLSNLTGNNYNFGISSVIAIKNTTTFVPSGITWASCIVPMHTTKLSKLPFNLTSIGTNSLQLQWKLSCPGMHVLIPKFEIIYCRLTNETNGSCGEEKRIFVNNSRIESYNLKELHPDSFYCVTMKMWNDKTAGEESDCLGARTGIKTNLMFPIIGFLQNQSKTNLTSFSLIFLALAITLTAVMIAICRKVFSNTRTAELPEHLNQECAGYY